MEKLLEHLFDKKMLKILRLFLADKDRQFYLREIAKQTKVPIATTSRNVDKLIKLELIRLIMINKFKFYQLNNDNPNIKYLESFLREETRIIDIFIDSAKKLPGIHSIIEHGDIGKDRASLLVLGDGVDAAELKTIVADIKEKYKFTISYLTLTQEQFNQMSQIGLYSGEKKVLYGKG
jgi:hypothetical protein